MSRLNNILSNDRHTKYSPSLDDSDFKDLKLAIKNAEDISINELNEPNTLFLGRKANPNINDLALEGSSISKSRSRKYFRTFKGTIGPDGTFPYVHTPKSISNMSNAEKETNFGSDSQYINNTTTTDKTYITIGDHFNNINIPDSFLSSYKFRIFISNLVSSHNYITFPNLQTLDSETLVTHNDSDKKVIEVKNNAVYIYPGKYKRCLKVYTCSNSIRNSAATTAIGGEVKYVGAANRGQCARLATRYLSKLSTYEGVGFSSLVRHPPDGYEGGFLSKVDEYITKANANQGVTDLTEWGNFTSTDSGLDVNSSHMIKD